MSTYQSLFLWCVRKFHGHNSLKEYYEKESCVHYIHNVSDFTETRLNALELDFWNDFQFKSSYNFYQFYLHYHKRLKFWTVFCKFVWLLFCCLCLASCFFVSSYSTLFWRNPWSLSLMSDQCSSPLGELLRWSFGSSVPVDDTSHTSKY